MTARKTNGMRDTSKTAYHDPIDVRPGHAALEDKITRLRSGDLGRYLPAQERHAAIIHLTETIAEFQLLIQEFSQHDAIPIIFQPATADASKSVQRLRYSTPPYPSAQR